MTDPAGRVQVTMRSAVLTSSGELQQHEAIDWVAPIDLDAYVADAQTHWQSVTVDTSAIVPDDVIAGGYTAPASTPVA